MKTIFKNYWKNGIIFCILVLITLCSIWQLDLMSKESFVCKLLSLLFLTPLFAGVIIGKLHSPEESEEKTDLSFNSSFTITLFAIILLFVRYTEQLTGFPLSSISVYHDNVIAGYLLQYFNLSPVLALLILLENISRLNRRITLKLSLLTFLQNIILALINLHYFLIVAIVTTINFLISPKKKYKLNWIVVSAFIIATIFSCIYLGSAPTCNYEFTALIILNAIVTITCAFIKRSLKYFSIALFLLVGGLVIPHSLISNFNALIFGITLFILLCKDDALEHPLSEYAKHLIVKPNPSLPKEIFYSNPYKATLTCDTLAELLAATLIGSNNKMAITNAVLQELNLNKTAFNFDLSIIQGILFEIHEDTHLALEWYESAYSKARGNVEKFIAATFMGSNNLSDIKEDLDYEEMESVEKSLSEFKAIREKLRKLKP